MNHDLVKANLNLHAVLKNLEDITVFDREMKELISSWNVSIKFIVKGGPSAIARFSGGRCTVEPGAGGKASIILWFLSPAHLNRMFDGTANPVPLKGFTKLGFLSKEFPKLTDRLSYYLKPDDELIKNKSYLEMNTRLTLNTAAFAVPEILEGDPVGRKISSKIPDGTAVMRILPSFHSVSITFSNGAAIAQKGDTVKPTAVMEMKNAAVANGFLNGKTDAFTAIASGDVVIKGLIPVLDNMSLLLDRIQHYLS
ncbi:MAG TPA: hypothetical protein P5120_17600 [Spirochaetota bacterium]|nr:hypothetical protein [Spirochaetota bacterium]HPJ42829.1 hypothetical protein [Spirochaetota bacterium]HPR39160.1 hypothetical protein [Spirochaetota bacterium]HRX49340.1 hypothetical protein [Spirochaetota bacterium]